MPDVKAMAESLGQLDTVFFNHDVAADVLTKIRMFHTLARSSHKSKMMLLSGVPGAGKTTLIEHYIDSQLRSLPANYGGTECLYVSVPAKCSQKMLASTILSELNDPCSEKGTTAEMTSRAADYIEHNRITLVVLDEFQHLIDRENRKVVYNTADWLKDLANSVSCAFLLSGLPALTRVIGENEQLERRVTMRSSLEAFSYKTKPEVRLFNTLLAMLAEKLPFENGDMIVHPDMAKAIHQATRGRVGLVVRLIQFAGLHLLSSGQKVLSVEAFAEAFTLLSEGESKKELEGAINPFFVAGAAA